MFAQNLCRGFPVEHFLRQNEIWRREAFREAIVNGPDESMSSLDFAASHPDRASSNPLSWRSMATVPRILASILNESVVAGMFVLPRPVWVLVVPSF